MTRLLWGRAGLVRNCFGLLRGHLRLAQGCSVVIQQLVIQTLFEVRSGCLRGPRANLSAKRGLRATDQFLHRFLKRANNL